MDKKNRIEKIFDLDIEPRLPCKQSKQAYMQRRLVTAEPVLSSNLEPI